MERRTRIRLVISARVHLSRRPGCVASLVTALVSALLLASCGGDDDGSSTGAAAGADRPPPVRGLADFHSHQFAHLGFAGRLHTHDLDPTTPCRLALNFSAESFRVRDLVRQGLLEEATEQKKESKCYPTATNLAGQQMDADSLRRAWAYGLRLLVVLAVNSEFLCYAAELSAKCPTDAEAVTQQLRAAHDFEDYIDAKSGGTGQGWYRIVETPAEAREVITDGKLAVVLGVEAANAFGCSIEATRPVVGIRNLLGVPNPELGWSTVCKDTAVGGDQAPRALALAERYWDLGARHFFPIHNLDGAAGGTALGIPLLHANANPSQLNPGGLFNRVPEIDRTIIAIRPSHNAWNCANVFEFDGGRCNKQGLSATGAALVKMLADYGAVIDVDHMSGRMKSTVWAQTGEYYPLVSGHSGIEAINHGPKDNEGQLLDREIDRIITWGGALGPILRPANSVEESDTWPPDAATGRHRCGGTTESFVQSYRYLMAKLSDKEETAWGTPVVQGIGFGSDFNGLAGWPMGRFNDALPSGFDVGRTLRSAFVGDNVTPHPGDCYEPFSGEPKVKYPFTSPSGQKFPESVLPWSGRAQPFSVNYNGVAHVGMIPDFVEELRLLLGCPADQPQTPCAETEPLWHGAEAYLQAWERSQALGGVWTGERSAGIWERCRGLRAQLLDATTAGDWVPGPGGEHPISVPKARAAMEEMGALGCYATAPSKPVDDPEHDRPFAPSEDWTTEPFYGQRATFFADVTGDGRADGIAVNDNAVKVRRSTGAGFGPTEDWIDEAFRGQRGTFFADVTGDGSIPVVGLGPRADAIAVDDDGIKVRRSSRTDFFAAENWTDGSFFGERDTGFADVTGDGRADAIGVNGGGIKVRSSHGGGFSPPEDWGGDPFFGQRGTFFADVTGEGKADAIALNDDGIQVRLSSGTDFWAPQAWTTGAFIGERGTFFADVTGDRRADAIAVNGAGIKVRRSLETGFSEPEDWTAASFFGQRGTFFADVTGDGRADALAVDDAGIKVRRATG